MTRRPTRILPPFVALTPKIRIACIGGVDRMALTAKLLRRPVRRPRRRQSKMMILFPVRRRSLDVDVLRRAGRPRRRVVLCARRARREAPALHRLDPAAVVRRQLDRVNGRRRQHDG